jgi:hypothetical protein
MTNNNVKSILGIDIRARYPEKEYLDYDPFKNPLIHKHINGTEIVPLDTVKLLRE